MTNDLKLIDYKERVINLFSDITENSTREVIEKIINLNIKDAEYINAASSVLNSFGFSSETNTLELPLITLNLSTYGGECYSGFGLCDAIKMSDTPIRIVCFGKVMSMGIPILLSSDYKIAHKNTTFMIHDVSSMTFGKSKDMEESIEQTVKLRKQLVDYICNNSKFPRKKLEEIVEKKQDFYFTAEEALKWKIIDEIIDSQPIEEEPTPEKTTKKKNNNKKTKKK